MIRTAHSLIGSSIINADGDRPKVSLRSDINAKIKQNFCQHSGNGIKARTWSGEWFWTSDMKFGEVHGVISNSGWNGNQKITGLTIEHPDLRNFLGFKGGAFHQVLDDHVEGNIWSKRWPVELAKI